MKSAAKEKALNLDVIEAQKREIEPVLEALWGDVTEGQGADLAERLEKLGMSERQEIDVIGEYYEDLDESLEAMTAKKAALDKRIKVFKNKKTKIRDFVKYVFSRWKITKIEGQLHTIWVQGDGGEPELDVFAPTDQIPKRFIKTIITEEVNREAIREALKVGDEEAKEVARFLEVGYSVRIK